MKMRIVALVWIIALLCSPIWAQERVRLTNGEWAPYLSEHLPHYGAASHIVKEAFAAVGIETQYGFYPWNRSYKLAKEGKWDGTLVWVYTPERAQDFLYTDVVIKEVEYLFHLKEKKIDWEKIEDLKGLTIGATLHTVYPPLEGAETQGLLRIERVGNYDNLYRRLLNHRIDAIPQVSQVGKYYLRTTLSPEDREKITYSKTVLQERKYHVILSKVPKGNKELIALFNKGLAIIRANGTYDAIAKALDSGAYDTPQ